MRQLRSAMRRLNDAYPWSHNDHYTPWVLRQVPPGATAALDVGCGTGGLVRRLAGRVGTVDAIELDPATAELARRSTAGLPGVTVATGDVLALPAVPSYDLITAVAVLHHMPAGPALRHLRALLRPGGRLAIVGVHRRAAVRDHLPDLLAVPANPLVGVVRRRDAAAARVMMSAPVAPATDTLPDVRRVAAAELGPCRIRRRLFWRYTLAFTEPGG